MMSKKIKSYDKSLKAKIALEAYKGEKTMLEICSQYNVPKTNVHDWLNKLKENVSDIFELPQDSLRKLSSYKQEIEKLHKVIGEITVENKFLKKKLEK